MYDKSPNKPFEIPPTVLSQLFYIVHNLTDHTYKDLTLLSNSTFSEP